MLKLTNQQYIFVERAKQKLLGSKRKTKESRRIRLPKKVNSFSLQKELLMKHSMSGYRFGEYKDKNGKKVFAKVWFGDKKDTYYYWLKNEVFIYSTATNSKFKRSLMPKFMEAHENQNTLVLLIEYINSNCLSFKKEIKLYDETVSKVRKLGNKFYKTLLPRIGRTGLLTFVGSYILLSFSFMVKDRSLLPLMLRVNHLLLKSFLVLAKSNWDTLIHNDLRNSILLYKSSVKIIDWQLATYSNKFLEIGQISLEAWNGRRIDPSVKSLKIYNEVFESLDSFRIYQIMCVFCSMVEMSSDQYSKHGKSFLIYSLNLSVSE